MSAPTFALLAGLVYLAAGALGLASNFLAASFLHHGAHFALGLWGLAAWTGAAGAVTYARALAGLGAAFALLGLTGLDHALGLLPLDQRDLWGHIITGALGAYFGFRTAALPEHRAERRLHFPADRRRAARPISLERRQGDTDRRLDSAFGL